MVGDISGILESQENECCSLGYVVTIGLQNPLKKRSSTGLLCCLNTSINFSPLRVRITQTVCSTLINKSEDEKL